jgi:DNA-binding MarR family transcriptional regulator
MSPNLQAELKQNKPFAHAEEELFLSLLRTVDLLGRSTAALMKEFNLSGAQYNVLRILRGAGPKGIPCGEVGSRMVTRDPDVTRLLDRMEKHKWVERQRVSSDRRVITASITPSGLALLQALDQPLVDLHRSQLGHLVPGEIEAILASLEKIRQHNQVKEA